MAHSHPPPAPRQRDARSVLCYAGVLTLAFAALEALGGWWTGSLALVSDAGHMLTDGGALMLGAIAGWLAKRPPSRRHSYGFGRAEVFAAIINAGTMLAIGAAIAYEAYMRLGQPREIQGAVAAAIALAGLAVNLGIIKWLAPHSHDMNARAAALHVLGDTLGSIGAFASGLVIALSGWAPIDAIASLFICALIAVSSLRLLREGVHALMEGVPLRVSAQAIGMELARQEGVESVHDLHIWTLSGSRIALSAHIVTRDISRWERTLRELQALLRARFGIDHVTLQPEPPASSVTRVPVPHPRRAKG
ncbi:MAG: cation diffusion facilitator family transporter [Betaproteobacteria bacterium]|nr:cation diffusion facilitator family transporter [Betaproteobacteria bacterium]